MNYIKSLSVAIMFACVLSVSAQVNWRIDQTHGHMGFSLKYMMLADYIGKFKGYDGKIQSKSDNDFTDAIFNLVIDINTVSAEVPGHEEILKSDKFFDVRNHPAATFRSTSMKPTAIKGNYELTGDLTIRGISKKVKLNAVSAAETITNPYFNRINYGFTIFGSIKRSDFGIGNYDLLDNNELVLGDEIKIVCSLILVKANEKIPMANNKISVNANVLEAYVGQYDYGKSGILSVTTENGKLYGKMPTNYRKELLPLSETKFFYEFFDLELEFVKDNTGKVTKLIRHRGGEKTDAVKLSNVPEMPKVVPVNDTSQFKDYRKESWNALMNKNYSQSIEYCKQGLKENSDDPTLKMNLAHAYLFSGEKTKALEIYREHLKIESGGVPFSRMIQEDFLFLKSRNYPSEVLDNTFKALQLTPNKAYKAIGI